MIYYLLSFSLPITIRSSGFIFICLALTISATFNPRFRRCRYFTALCCEHVLACIDKGLVLTQSCQLEIVVVTVEESLHWVTSQHHHVLLELFIILIFPIFINVLLIKIIFSRWNKWWLDFFIPQILPWVILKPWMILHLSRSIKSESIHRLSLNSLIDKICSFDWPTTRDLIALDLNLLWENVVTDLLTSFTNIGPL